MKTKIALAQLTAINNDMEANLNKALKTMEEMAAEGVDIVAFPELFYSTRTPCSFLFDHTFTFSF